MSRMGMRGKEPDFCIITVPTESNKERTWQHALQVTEQHATAFAFDVPDLKVGSMNALVKEAESLSKNDAYAEKTVSKIAKQLEALLKDKDRTEESLQANGKTVEGYLTSFKWDGAKFNVNTSLADLCADVISKVTDIDNEMKKKVQMYNKSQGSLNYLEKQSSGSLQVRSLDTLVKKEDFILDSDFLQTVVVVVPIKRADDWLGMYEKLHDCVVPRTSKQLYDDHTSVLFSVTLFKRPESAVHDFAHACTKEGFTCREFEFNAEEIANREKTMVELKSDVMKKYNSLVRWLTTMFGEAYIAWIHTKALRLFVESVLRYGLPVNFVTIGLKPHGKTYAKLRHVLEQNYGHLDANSKSGNVDLPQMSIVNELGIYYPYVNVDVKLGMLSH